MNSNKGLGITPITIYKCIKIMEPKGEMQYRIS